MLTSKATAEPQKRNCEVGCVVVDFCQHPSRSSTALVGRRLIYFKLKCLKEDQGSLMKIIGLGTVI